MYITLRCFYITECPPYFNNFDTTIKMVGGEKNSMPCVKNKRLFLAQVKALKL
jgi:hypothetical protein